MLPVFGSRCWQAFSAAWSWELLTPSCCAVSLAIPPLLSGAGEFRPPPERTQREKASAFWEFVDGEFADPPAFGEPPEPVDELPLHADSRARPAVAMMAAALRAAGGRARRGRRMTRVRWFIMLSSGLDDRAGRGRGRRARAARCPGGGARSPGRCRDR